MAARARHLALLSALLTATACSESIEVLGPARAPSLIDDAGQIPQQDAGQDAGDPPPPPDDPCGGCDTLELCAVNECVATSGIRSLDAHLRHTCMVRDARAFCWGDNEHGQLGVGDQADRLSPARIGTGNDWLQLTTGEQHTCGIRAPGVLYCWGRNQAAQLGVGDTEPRTTPAQLTGTRLWRSVACGGDSCCAIDASDQLYCWGDNSEGKLGQLDRPGDPDAATPLRVDDTRWQRVEVGQGHVCAIREAGTLHCWARNTKVELGLGPLPGQIRGTPQVGDASDWIDVSASQHSSCGVRANGTLWCWGLNSFFEVGSPMLEERVDRPRQVGTDSDWVATGAGWFHSCALKGSGALFCWGRAIEGQLAQGGGDPVQPPTKVLSGLFERFALGNFYTCGATTEGTVQCWGANDNGELGTGDTERHYEPATIP
jgi:alpha-tubulin suppressor-like RCC1 family protein